jgi:hypothetical protein
MGIGPETTPTRAGRFVLWLGIALLIGLAVFLVVLYFNGHKAGILNNSNADRPSLSWAG